MINKLNRLRTQGQILATLTLVSFVCCFAIGLSNSLWLIPTVVGYVGMNVCNTRWNSLNKIYKKRFGFDEEEYF